MEMDENPHALDDTHCEKSESSSRIFCGRPPRFLPSERWRNLLRRSKIAIRKSRQSTDNRHATNARAATTMAGNEIKRSPLRKNQIAKY
jgi:hypothetical protein